MRITSQEEYGFRCIWQLAAHGESKCVTISEIASQEGLSMAYVTKLLGILKKNGLVESVRGVHGGYKLERDASEITLSEILQALDGVLLDPNFCQCFPGNEEECVRFNGSCSLRSVWSVLAEHIEGVLQGITLKDLVEQEEPLMLDLMRLKFAEQALRLAPPRKH